MLPLLCTAMVHGLTSLLRKMGFSLTTATCSSMGIAMECTLAIKTIFRLLR